MVVSRRMLKQIPNFVLGLLASSTYPRGYASGAASPAAAFGKGRVLARQGWEGVMDDLFEHPA
jgi:hypothetical protein